MDRPKAVRIGVILLLLALLLRAAFLVINISSRSEVTTTGLAGEAVSLLIFAAFIHVIARGRNWARLVFAFLYVTNAVLAFFFGVLRPHLASADFADMAVPQISGIQLAWLVLVGAGMICLFFPSAAAWYHGRSGSSLTRA